MAFSDRFGFVRDAAPLRETILPGSGGGYDPDESLTAPQGGSTYYRRLSQARRDLNPLTQERAIELAFWLYDMNPVAKRILETTRDWVMGEGVKVTISGDSETETDELQRVLDSFWNDPVNQLDRKLSTKVLELGLFGEQIYTVTVNPKDGSVRLGTVDPAMLGDVIKDVNGETELAITLKRQVNSSMADRRLKVVQPQLDPSKKWFGRLVPCDMDASGKPTETYVVSDTLSQMDDSAEPIEPLPPGAVPDVGRTKKTETYLGSCFYFTVNKVANAKRGRSDLLSLIDWVDAYDQVLFDRVDNQLLQRSFIYDVTVEGADQKQIDEYRQANMIEPRPGSVNFHNERVRWEVVAPSLNAHDASIDANMLISHIATGAGLAKTWLNGSVDVNLATASALAEPVFKHLTMRQKEVRHLIETICTFAMDQAEVHGRVKKRKNQKGSLSPVPWRFNVTLPDIQSRDIKGIGQTLVQSADALAILVDLATIDVELAQDVVQLLFGQMGVEFDMEQLRQRLAKAKAEQDKEDATVLAVGGARAKALLGQEPGDPNGPPQTQGGQQQAAKAAQVSPAKGAAAKARSRVRRQASKPVAAGAQ